MNVNMSCNAASDESWKGYHWTCAELLHDAHEPCECMTRLGLIARAFAWHMVYNIAACVYNSNKSSVWADHVLCFSRLSQLSWLQILSHHSEATLGTMLNIPQYSITDTIDVDILLHNKCGHSLQCLVLQQLLQVDHYHMVLNIESDILFCGYY